MKGGSRVEGQESDGEGGMEEEDLREWEREREGGRAERERETNSGVTTV